MLKAIIFDFFDVIRSDPYNAWLKKHGYEREGEFLKASQELDSGQSDISSFFERLGALSGQRADEVRREFDAVSTVDSDVLLLIEELKRDYKIGLLSNSPSDFIRDILRENDLHTYFDEIIVSSEVGHIKPSKEIFDIALERLKSKPSEAVFIDDNERHIEGAENAGIVSVRFKSAPQLENELRTLDVLRR